VILEGRVRSVELLGDKKFITIEVPDARFKRTPDVIHVMKTKELNLFELGDSVRIELTLMTNGGVSS
jgi:hypothetical protein